MKWHLLICGVLLLVLALVAGIYILHHLGEINVEELLSRYGYFLVLVWTGFHGTSIVVIAGALSEMLGLNPWLLALCAFIGGGLSDQAIFSFCRFKGDKILVRFPGLAGKIEKTSGMFERHTGLLILFSRFVYGIRNITPVFFGFNGIPIRKFFFLNMLGAFIWAVSLTFGGFYLGQAFLAMMGGVGMGMFYAVLTTLLLIALWRIGNRLFFSCNKEENR